MYHTLISHVLADYLRLAASSFHNFYHDCRIIGVEDELMIARIHLLKAAQHTLRNGLTILGISAPERM